MNVLVDTSVWSLALRRREVNEESEIVRELRELIAENAPSDPMYVKLAGEDHYPDALISRISAQNITQSRESGDIVPIPHHRRAI